jgi:protein phosphatase
VEVDVVRLDEPMRPGDTLLVCTDGLHGQVTDEELARLASGESLDRACRDLIQLANQRGGPDNITVAMARRVAPADDPYAPPRRARADEHGSPAKRRALQLLIVALIALLLALCGLAWVVFGMMHAQRQDQTSLNADAAARGDGLTWR